jgi:hypothetical protein
MQGRAAFEPFDTFVASHDDAQVNTDAAPSSGESQPAPAGEVE